MAKSKTELLDEAKALKLDVTAKNTVAEINAAIAGAATKEKEDGTTKESDQASNQDQEVKIAKAGKRSEKGLKEAEEKQAKEERKAHATEEKAEAEAKPKQLAKPARSKLERSGKKFRESAKLIDKTKTYGLEDAVELARTTSPVKFDATVELHVNLGVDPRQADQNIRDNVLLPAGSGKKVRIAVFDDAKVDGVEISGVENVTKALEKGEMNFDILIATPAQMPKLGKFARVLGPRGLMPNPKSGTVTTDVAKAVAEAKAGRVEYRVDSTGIVHMGIGKASFTSPQLLENLQAVLASIKNNKPNSLKGIYIKSIHLTTTMGPSIAVDVAAIG